MAPPLDPAHRSEFGTVASWTAEVLASMDEVSQVAGASRGSASPSALAWLAECLGLGHGRPLLDVGGGLGGPAAWAVEHYDVVATVVEPMVEACAGARSLFGHAGVVATASALPFPDRSFPTAWMLGVLDTVPCPAEVLRDVRRVLDDDGRLGLLAYVACGQLDRDALPSGNAFQTSEQLEKDLRAAGFALIDRTDAAALPAAPVDWRVRQERLERAVAERHGADRRHEEAEEQSRRMGSLLSSGAVGTVLLHLVCV